MAGYDIWIWVAVIGASLLLEFVTMDITSIWFSIGGLVALLLAAFNVAFEIQIVVFVVLSAVLLLTLRRWARNKLLSSEGTTNIDLMKKEKFELLTSITEHEKGTVKYSGVIWNAISEDDKPIPAGAFVHIVEVKGNKLVVKKEGNE